MRLARDQSEDQEQGQKRFRLLSVRRKQQLEPGEEGGRGRVSVNATCVPVHTLFLSSRELTIPVFAQKHLFS